MYGLVQIQVTKEMEYFYAEVVWGEVFRFPDLAIQQHLLSF